MLIGADKSDKTFPASESDSVSKSSIMTGIEFWLLGLGVVFDETIVCKC